MSLIEIGHTRGKSSSRVRGTAGLRCRAWGVDFFGTLTFLSASKHLNSPRKLSRPRPSTAPENRAATLNTRRFTHMRSELIFGALTHVSNRYQLCQLASKATRKLHKPNSRLQDTTNEVLYRFRTANPGMKAPIAEPEA